MINVYNMIIEQIDDTKGNENSKMMGNGKYVHFYKSLPIIQWEILSPTDYIHFIFYWRWTFAHMP